MQVIGAAFFIELFFMDERVERIIIVFGQFGVGALREPSRRSLGYPIRRAIRLTVELALGLPFRLALRGTFRGTFRFTGRSLRARSFGTLGGSWSFFRATAATAATTATTTVFLFSSCFARAFRLSFEAKGAFGFGGIEWLHGATFYFRGGIGADDWFRQILGRGRRGLIGGGGLGIQATTPSAATAAAATAMAFLRTSLRICNRPLART